MYEVHECVRRLSMGGRMESEREKVSADVAYRSQSISRE